MQLTCCGTALYLAKCHRGIISISASKAWHWSPFQAILVFITTWCHMIPTLHWGKSDFMISGKLVVICKGKGICAADCWYLYPRQVAPAAQQHQQQQQQSAEQNHFYSREHLQCWACSLLTNVNIRQIQIQIQIQIQKESLLLQSICSGF